MSRILPPLNALRAFEAAARHLSFTRAADELFVTQAAVSHQVKTLEDHLGLKLFKRLNRALILTEEGQIYFPQVRDALDQLAQATKSLQKSDDSGVLTVSVIPSFASLWLVPRVYDFTSTHKDIDLRIAADDKLIDFQKDDVDCAIRYGTGNWPNLYKRKFMGEEIFPICTPQYLEKHGPLDTPQDLKGKTLLYDYALMSIVERHLTWAYWFKATKVGEIDHVRGPLYSHTYMVVQSCLAGEGIALGRSSLIQNELDNGRLIRLFNHSINLNVAYYFVCPHESIERAKVKAFHDWLLSC